MRVASIEELANGYVLRHRCGDEQVAHAFSGDNALVHLIDHLVAYFTEPREQVETPSFAMLVALKGETEALEKRPTRRDERTPLPTESHVPLTQNHIPTVKMKSDEVATVKVEETNPFDNV